MFSVIFEVHPNDGRKDDYLELAKHLKPILETIDGFVDNERFESRLTARLGAVAFDLARREIRGALAHRGRASRRPRQGPVRNLPGLSFARRRRDRRYRPAEASAGSRAPLRRDRGRKCEGRDLHRDHAGQRCGLRQPGRSVAGASRPRPNSGAVAEHDVWASIYNPGKMALLVAWKDPKAAETWKPKKIDGIETLRHRKVRVVRDYGRFDRREAPQFYADVKGRETRHPAPARKADADGSAKTAAVRETPACRRAHARGRARRSGAGSETLFRD